MYKRCKSFAAKFLRLSHTTGNRNMQIHGKFSIETSESLVFAVNEVRYVNVIRISET